ncbi:MAG: methylated-DNA--[protein]-cysteine S-methyltransferase [Chitinophagaceae bacterium]|nr:MAG: methylated-DNA--[protein]-cysteine S-methyltransferase [Chitinophagaceae bacterium]
MNQESVYYKSPIGLLKLSGEQNSLTEVLFVSTEKNGIDEGSIENFDPPALPILQQTIQQLNEYFEGRRMDFDLALAQTGTAFQQKVWNGLMTIKAGSNLSYLSFSKRLGDVKAIRAVGTANGRNKISIIVPCHRVIGSNGSLVGYGGDLWRKKWLLDHEAKFTHGVRTLFAEEEKIM